MSLTKFERKDNVLYLVQDVPPDGNCFFHCLSHAVARNFDNSQMFRNLICQRIVNAWDYWQNKVQMYHGHAMSLDVYKTGMMDGNWWAHASEIEAAYYLLKFHMKGT